MKRKYPFMPFILHSISPSTFAAKLGISREELITRLQLGDQDIIDSLCRYTYYPSFTIALLDKNYTKEKEKFFNSDITPYYPKGFLRPYFYSHPATAVIYTDNARQFLTKYNITPAQLGKLTKLCWYDLVHMYLNYDEGLSYLERDYPSIKEYLK